MLNALFYKGNKKLYHEAIIKLYGMLEVEETVERLVQHSAVGSSHEFRTIL